MSSPGPPIPPLPPNVDRGYQHVAVQWASTSVAIVIVTLRLGVRGFIHKKIRWDDYTITLALACAIAQAILSTFTWQMGFGQHIQYVQPGQIPSILHLIIVFILLNITGSTLVRLSVCFFTIQLLPWTAKAARRRIYVLMILFTVIALVAFFSTLFQCIPMRGPWDKTIHAKCLAVSTITHINIAYGVLSGVMDLLCVILPMIVLRKLQITRRNKIAIYIVLAFGLFPAGFGVARTSAYHSEFKDPFWDLVPEAIYACLEENVGIIIACVPALRKLVIAVQKRRQASTAQQSHSSKRDLRAPSVSHKLTFESPQWSPIIATSHVSSPSTPLASPKIDEKNNGRDSPARQWARRMSTKGAEERMVRSPKGSPQLNEKDSSRDSPARQWARKMSIKSPEEGTIGPEKTFGNEVLGGYQCKIEGGVSPTKSAYSSEGKLSPSKSTHNLRWLDVERDIPAFPRSTSSLGP